MIQQRDFRLKDLLYPFQLYEIDLVGHVRSKAVHGDRQGLLPRVRRRRLRLRRRRQKVVSRSSIVDR